MEQLFVSLKNTLADEKSVYESLLDLSQQKKNVLIKGDVEALEAITNQEMVLVTRLKSLEKVRETTQSSLNMNDDSASFDQVIAQIGSTLQKEFVELRSQLKTVIQKLAETTEINRKLIYSQLEYTSFCVDLLTRKVYMGNTYGNMGYINENKTTRFSLVDQSV